MVLKSSIITSLIETFFPHSIECTADQHFVFAIRHDSASIPVDPTKLVIPGNPNCKPVIVNDKVAIFKFKLTECGARNYVSRPLLLDCFDNALCYFKNNSTALRYDALPDKVDGRLMVDLVSIATAC